LPNFTFCCSARTFRSHTSHIVFRAVYLLAHVGKKDGHMRICRVFLGLALAVGCTVAIPNPVFAQEYRGTMEQQMACTPDVFRLCGAQMPDVNRIVACLRENTPQLSGPCRAVFESNASAPNQAAPPHGYGEPRPYGQ
jgi:hypothetical protein